MASRIGAPALKANGEIMIGIGVLEAMTKSRIGPDWSWQFDGDGLWMEGWSSMKRRVRKYWQNQSFRVELMKDLKEANNPLAVANRQPNNSVPCAKSVEYLQ